MSLAAENFNRLVYNPSGQDPVDPLAHLHARLADRIRRVEAERPLDEAMRRQLQLAGSGDIQHFLWRVEEARVAFEVARQDYATGMAAVRRLEFLAIQFHEGPFGNGSLFRKVVGAVPPAPRSS